jgi:adenylate cyclase
MRPRLAAGRSLARGDAIDAAGMTSLANQPNRALGRRLLPRIGLSRVVRNPVVKAGFATLVITAAVILLRSYGWLQPVELLAYDTLRVAWAGHAQSNHVVLIGANEQDITAADADGNRRWGWPLRDGKLAALLERLASWQPRAIAVDLYRDIPEPPGTEELDAVLKRHPEILWVFKLKEDAAHPGIAPPQVLRKSDRAVLADTLTDPDAVVRRGLLFADDGVNQYESMAMAMALAYLAPLHIGLQPANGDDLRLGKAVIHPLDSSRGPYVAVDARGYQILLDYRGGPQPFRQRSLSAVMDRNDMASLVRGKLVVLGVTAESVKDSFTTPFSTGFNRAEPVNGIAIHAHLADQLIREAIDGTPVVDGLPRRYEDLWIALWALGGAVLGLAVRTTLPVLAGGGAGISALGIIAYAAFGRGLLLPAIAAAAAWLGAGVLTNQLLYAATNRARARLRESFERYLPPAVIERLVDADTLPELGGERREISVLFTDVASFTTFSEGRDPQELAEIANQYFDGVCGAVFAQEGNVNSFMGDGVLAFFGAPQAQPDHADRAVAAALGINRFAEQFSRDQNARGVNFGHTRVGIHTGIAFVGNVGAKQSMKYTALGDMLNTGSRLEGLNKAIGSRICASLDIVEKCRTQRFRPVGDFIVKGRQGATPIFVPIDPERESPEALAAYDNAYHVLVTGTGDALARFTKLHRENPDDPIAAFHYHRLCEGEVGTLVEMHEK